MAAVTTAIIIFMVVSSLFSDNTKFAKSAYNDMNKSANLVKYRPIAWINSVLSKMNQNLTTMNSIFNILGIGTSTFVTK